MSLFPCSDVTRAVLGRTGFLGRVRVALIDYDRNLYVSTYDDTH